MRRKQSYGDHWLTTWRSNRSTQPRQTRTYFVTLMKMRVCLMRVVWAGGLCGSASFPADGAAVIRCLCHFYNKLRPGGLRILWRFEPKSLTSRPHSDLWRLANHYTWFLGEGCVIAHAARVAYSLLSDLSMESTPRVISSEGFSPIWCGVKSCRLDSKSHIWGSIHTCWST